jgi:hypothetical protein
MLLPQEGGGVARKKCWAGLIGALRFGFLRQEDEATPPQIAN